MDICYDLIYLDKEEQGGISRMWLEYFKLLPKSDINATFLTSKNNLNVTKEYLLKNDYFNSHVIKESSFIKNKLLNKVRKSSFYRNLILNNIIPSQVKVFHSTDFINPFFKSKKYKIVTTIHDMVFWDQEAYFSKNIFYYERVWSIYHSLKVSDKIITVSETSKNAIIKYYPWAEDKIIVNYHGLGNSFLNEEIIFTKKEYFLFIGGRNNYKNYDLLVETFAQISNKYKKWKLIVIGENKKTFKQEQKKYKELGIFSSVIDKGLVSEKKMIKLIKEASALVIPSLNEGFNFPLLEGLALGCPILSSKIPVSKEIGKNYVTYFDNNKKSLYRYLEKNITNNTDKNNLIKSQNYARTFNWQNSFKNLLKVYESCL